MLEVFCMKSYKPPKIFIIPIVLEDGVVVGSGSANVVVYNNDVDVKQSWEEDDTVDREWEW